jgi:hypothetical protein
MSDLDYYRKKKSETNWVFAARIVVGFVAVVGLIVYVGVQIVEVLKFDKIIITSYLRPGGGVPYYDGRVPFPRTFFFFIVLPSFSRLLTLPTPTHISILGQVNFTLRLRSGSYYPVNDIRCFNLVTPINDPSPTPSRANCGINAFTTYGNTTSWVSTGQKFSQSVAGLFSEWGFVMYAPPDPTNSSIIADGWFDVSQYFTTSS